MSSSKVYSRRYLPRTATAVHAGAYHETALSLAGRSKHLWESITGGPSVSGEVPSVEVNPQGETGYDMSGPPFGAALLLPVWWWGVDTEATNTRWRVNTMRLVGSLDGVIRARFWNRPHAVAVDGTAPLDRLLFSWRAAALSVDSTSFSVLVRNLATGQQHTYPRTIASTAVATYSETGALVEVDPGLNEFEITVRRATGGIAQLNVRTMALTVVAKRKHGLTFPG